MSHSSPASHGKNDRPDSEYDNSILLIDKPLHWTSFDAVKKLRSAGRIKKIGHAGTLDPLASGLLIVCTGKMTKRIESIQAQEKEYEFTIRLGESTPSFDLESEVDKTVPVPDLSDEDINQILQTQFLGPLMQVPPLFSAVKVDGKRAYTLARKGSDHELPPKPITVTLMEILKREGHDLTLRAVCSKGTYVRSFARDIALALGTVGHLTWLRRTRIGEFRVEDAYSIENLATRLFEARTVANSHGESGAPQAPPEQ